MIETIELKIFQLLLILLQTSNFSLGEIFSTKLKQV